MCDRAARAVTTEMVEREPGRDLELALPRFDRRIWTADPSQVGFADQHRYPAEGAAPLNLYAEHVRVTRGDRDDLAACQDPADGVVVEVAGWVPQQVAARSDDEMGLLADPDGWFDRDPEQVVLEFGHRGS